MEVLVGDRVRWASAGAGWLRGTVLKIFETQDAYGEYVDYYQIAYHDRTGQTGIALVADHEMEDLHFRVNFRDVAIQEKMKKVDLGA